VEEAAARLIWLLRMAREMRGTGVGLKEGAHSLLEG
jgi:hypothetical protein